MSGTCQFGALTGRGCISKRLWQWCFKFAVVSCQLDGYDDIGLFSTDYMDEVGGYVSWLAANFGYR